MKNCTRCKYADWERTKAARLSPSGGGRCRYPYKIAKLPEAFYWLVSMTPCGGNINRKRELENHCVYYSED